MKNSFEITLEELLNDSNFSKYLPFALSALKASGVIRALRERGRPMDIPAATDNYVAAQASEAQRSIGYNNCLDDLLYFAERYLKTKTQTTSPELSYGAAMSVLESGDLTKEELDAIVSGVEPETIYAKLYAGRARPAAGTGSNENTH